MIPIRMRTTNDDGEPIMTAEQFNAASSADADLLEELLLEGTKNWRCLITNKKCEERDCDGMPCLLAEREEERLYGLRPTRKASE